MLIIVGALVLTWLVVFLPVIGLLIAEDRRHPEEREHVTDGKASIERA